MADFRNGSVRLEFWSCFGKGSLRLRLAESSVTLPFEGGSRQLSGGQGKDGIATVGASDKPLGAAKVFLAKGSALGVTVNGSHFGIFGPTGSNWRVNAGDDVNSVQSRLAGKAYLSDWTRPRNVVPRPVWDLGRAVKTATHPTTDFGLAKPLRSRSRTTGTNELVRSSRRYRNQR